MNVLVFDIETVPDTAGGARLYDLHGLADADIARAMTTKQLQKNGSDFLPLHLHRIVAISVVLRNAEQLKVWSVGEEDSDEGELIKRFYEGLEKFTPTLVSWNGGGFDLPVLHYRSLIHQVAAASYWEVGDEVRDFRYNNYLSRFHWRHIDLMDVLAGFVPRAAAPLTEVAQLLGLPGKLGMDGGGVWDAFCQGGIDKIRAYCEVDVLNTYLIYLQWEKVRGNLTAANLQNEFDLVKKYLAQASQKHFKEFLDAWQGED